MVPMQLIQPLRYNIIKFSFQLIFIGVEDARTDYKLLKMVVIYSLKRVA